MKDRMNDIEDALRNAFSGLQVQSIDLLVNTTTEWVDLSAPHRYRWIGGKFYSVSYDLNDNGRAILTEVVRTAKQNDDRLIPLEELRAFMRPHMHRTLPPYESDADENFQRGYRKAICDLMVMLGINTCASKKERELCKEIYGDKYL